MAEAPAAQTVPAIPTFSENTTCGFSRTVPWSGKQQEITMATEKIQARYLQAGDIIGSGETVNGVSAGVRTPRGRVEVILDKDGRTRMSIWGAYTLISVRRADR
jgi:hypothetical protein